MRQPLRLVLLLLAFTFSFAADAAGVRIVPLRLDMTAKGGSASLEITNLTNQNMGVQIEAKAWAQPEGADLYTDTQDLLFAPPILAIPAGKSKTVRFRLRRGPTPDRELAYRIYVQQLAAAPDNAAGQTALSGGVEVRLKLGVPLFVKAVKPVPPGLEAATLRLAGGHNALRLKNPGGTHLKIIQAEILNGSGVVVAETRLTDTQTNYLLAGSESTWPLLLPASNSPANLSNGRYSLRLKTDYYSPRGVGGFSAEGFTTRTIDIVP